MTEKDPGRQEDWSLPERFTYDVYRLGPFLGEATRSSSRLWEHHREEVVLEAQRILRRVWGEDITIPRYIHPSVASNCLRWSGYEQLGYTPDREKTEQNDLILMAGTKLHEGFMSYKLRPFGQQEQALVDDASGISGRSDFLIRNPKTGEYQVVDFKFVGTFEYRLINREGLPAKLRPTKKIVAPRTEHKKQLLYYMWAWRKRGFDVAMGNIVYFSRDTFERKEALIPWDPETAYEADQFVKQIQEAHKTIARGELPDATVVSPHICAGFCPYLAHCDHGQHFARGDIKKKQRRPVPKFVRKKLEQRRQKRQEEMRRLGLVQPTLFDMVPAPQEGVIYEQGLENRPNVSDEDEGSLGSAGSKGSNDPGSATV